MSETFLNLIQTAEREIRRDTEDLTRLKRRYPGFDFIRVTGDDRLPNLERVATELSFLQNAVLTLIQTSTLREWTSRSVLNELVAGEQVSFPSDDAGMNAVGLALVSLADAGRITRTHQGRGRDPHRYRRIEGEDKAEAPAGTGA